MRARRIALLASLAVVLGTASAACGVATTKGSGDVVTRDLTVPAFSRLEVSYGFRVTVAAGATPSLRLRVDDNLERRVDTGVDGDTLRIGLKPGASVSGATLEAEVTAPSLVGAQASGASRIGLRDRLTGQDLRVELSGASELDGPVELGSATASLSGSSRLRLSGQVARLSAGASGASRLDLLELRVDQLEIDLSGASSAEVSVRRTISAGLSGASSLRYRGQPTFTRQDVSGGSSVSRIA